MTGWPLAIGIFITGGCLSLYCALRAIRDYFDEHDGEGELLLTEDMIDCNQSVAVVPSESDGGDRI